MAIDVPSFGYTAGAGIDNATLVDHHIVVERKPDPFAVDQLNPTKVRRTVEYLTVQAVVDAASLFDVEYETFRAAVATVSTTETYQDFEAGGVYTDDVAPGVGGGAKWRWAEVVTQQHGDGTATVIGTLTAESTWAADV